jgi:hypothetical protein
MYSDDKLIKCALHAQLRGTDSPYVFINDCELTKDRLESNRWWSKHICDNKYKWVVDEVAMEELDYMDDFFEM